MDPDLFIPLAGMFTGIVLVLGLPLVLVHSWKLFRRNSAATTVHLQESDHRLERIEQAIDAMAVEVERISEGQRFITKVLSDRKDERVAIPASSARHQA